MRLQLTSSHFCAPLARSLYFALISYAFLLWLFWRLFAKKVAIYKPHIVQPHFRKRIIQIPNPDRVPAHTPEQKTQGMIHSNANPHSQWIINVEQCGMAGIQFQFSVWIFCKECLHVAIFFYVVFNTVQCWNRSFVMWDWPNEPKHR